MVYDRSMELQERITSLKLTEQQARYCEAFVTTAKFDDVKALRLAGYKIGQNLHVLKGKMAQNERIQEYIGILKSEIANRVNLDPDSIIKEQMHIAFASENDFFRVEGVGVSRRLVMRPWDEIPEEKKAAISEIEVKTLTDGTQVTKIKLHNKQTALDFLQKIVERKRADEGETREEKQAKQGIIINQVKIMLSDSKFRHGLEMVTEAFTGNKVKLNKMPGLNRQIEMLTSEMDRMSESVGKGDDDGIIDVTE